MFIVFRKAYIRAMKLLLFVKRRQYLRDEILMSSCVQNISCFDVDGFGA